MRPTTWPPSHFWQSRSNGRFGRRKLAASARALIAALCAAAVSCDDARAPAGKGGGERSSAPAVRQHTTRGELALRNLNDRIATLERRVAGSRSDLATRSLLFDLLLTRVQFLGTFADFARLDALAQAALVDFPEQGGAHLLAARALSAVHRFEEAEAELARAAALGADTALALASLHVAQGRRLEAARELSSRRATAAPSLEHFTAWANAEAALGEFERADEHYRAALDSYRDVSPFPVAYLSFRRGVMWAEMANQPGRARAAYVEAVSRLPEYVAANVHLAEMEAESGDRAQAIERLRRVLAHGSDPEPMGYLGELLRESTPDEPSAGELIARAGARYAELLSRHPAAFADHAAEFFMGPGADPARALELARQNLKLRQTPRAYELAIEAARAAGDGPLLCSFVESARPLSSRSHPLRAALEAEASRCAVVR